LKLAYYVSQGEKIHYPYTYIEDVTIPLSETKSRSPGIKEVIINKSPGVVLASKILEDLFNAAVGIKTEQLLAQHQENLTKHYDELTKDL
jgi:hypothetical protein